MTKQVKQKEKITEMLVVKRNIKAISSFFTSFGNERNFRTILVLPLFATILCVCVCHLYYIIFTTHKVNIKVENEKGTTEKTRTTEKIRFLLKNW